MKQRQRLHSIIIISHQTPTFLYHKAQSKAQGFKYLYKSISLIKLNILPSHRSVTTEDIYILPIRSMAPKMNPRQKPRKLKTFREKTKNPEYTFQYLPYSAQSPDPI